jgi:hypothetical protein
MADEREVVELATRLEDRAIAKLQAYDKCHEARDRYDNSDRLDEADKLLRCAAALRAKAKGGE